jgi:hypothetical protein
MIPAMIASLRHFLGWLVCAFRSREDLVLENLALHQQLLALHAQRPRRRFDGPAQAVLGCVTNVLVWVEEASRSGHSPNRRETGIGRGFHVIIVNERHLKRLMSSYLL